VTGFIFALSNVFNFQSSFPFAFILCSAVQPKYFQPKELCLKTFKMHHSKIFFCVQNKKRLCTFAKYRNKLYLIKKINDFLIQTIHVSLLFCCFKLTISFLAYHITLSAKFFFLFIGYIQHSYGIYSNIVYPYT